MKLEEFVNKPAEVLFFRDTDVKAIIGLIIERHENAISISFSFSKGNVMLA